jgi:hypothetical protein
MSVYKSVLEVHLYGKLRRFAEGKEPTQDSIVRVKVTEGETIEDVVHRIGIPLEELGANIFLNGGYSVLTRKVTPGDRLGLFPDNMQLLYKWYFREIGNEGSDDQD